MASRLVPFRREHTGTAPGDRLQVQAQQAAQKVNGIIGNYVLKAAATASLTANVTTVSVPMADIAGLSLSVTAQPGDILILDGSMAGAITVGAGFGYTMFAVVDGSATSAVNGAHGMFSNIVAVTAPMTGLWVVQNKGTVTAKVQGQTAGGTTMTLYGSASASGLRCTIRLQHLRAVS